ncbi:DNA-directed RNA polymerase subunit [Spironucleus salmonicida]|uniref:DNA-directed RNA polymerase subunit n=1 Tax=Spironucleus salmonicida TaxID=348837 RepID=V6LNV7_9EUKA|nr:DNA-directed RNA polymerase subunit [Spironucleus salmonicida]|eukprot:EST46285.1 DNA-directed RNA polymerase [Spironucleus salmonicida]
MFSKDLFNIFHSISETNFSLYTPEQAKEMSVAQISIQDSKDKDGNFILNGIYDPRLGVSRETCKICNKRYLDCQGHLGHIELQQIVYNPLTYGFAVKIFKTQCQSCHKLRITDKNLLIFTTKFACIRAGLISIAQDAQEMSEDQLNKAITMAEDVLLQNPIYQQTQMLEQLYQQTIKELFSSKGKCPHCKNISAKLIEQKCVKIFRVDLEEAAIDLNTDGKEKDTSYTFILPGQVLEEIEFCFQNHNKLMTFIFGQEFIPSSLFLKNLLVLPNKLRQIQFLNGREAANQISSNLAKIVQANNGIGVGNDKNQLFYQVVQLQLLVNSYIDSSYSETNQLQGIKQRLEKKTGLFRQNIQGKRVNFAARSVISPDINLSTTEIGIPDYFAKTLTFPEPVNQYNLEYLQSLVKNGKNYPGANMIEFSYGKRIDLTNLSNEQLEAQSKLLAQFEPQTTVFVHRHVMPGDPMIFNRQPSLHRLSMLVHRARILPGHSKTIRFHYANCNGYNADFDGDEMNVHMPQSYLQVADALQIALNDEHYISSTGGNPQRGLIQDSVVGGILLTKLDSFYDSNKFQQLCWVGCSHISREQSSITLKNKIELLQGKNKVTNANPFSAMTDTKFIGTYDGEKVLRSNGDNFGYLADDFNLLYCSQEKVSKDNYCQKILVLDNQAEIILPQPAIMFPGPIYTGKQVVSVLLSLLCKDQFINIKSGNTLPASTWGIHGKVECQTQVINNELVTGLIDKKHIAAAANGLTHSIQEIFGGLSAGMFLTAYGRLTAFILQQRGFTCSLEDMILTHTADQNRTNIYNSMTQIGLNSSKQFLNSDTNDIVALKAGLQYELQKDNKAGARYDSVMQGSAMDITSQLASACHPSKLTTTLPRNSLAFMILTGAKGSSVNLQMITSCLGQQSLEGRRVPMTVTGRTIPCYRPFDNIDFLPGGYVYDRFLTGIRPQSFFFHHQAGREGLIDTAVKTATSGYFQRCIVKSVEGLTVRYDGSVRDADGSIVQKLYGGDGLDPTKVSMLENFDFQQRNSQVYQQTQQIQSDSQWNSSSVSNLQKIKQLVDQVTLEQLLSSPLKFEKQLSKLQKYYCKIFGQELEGEILLLKIQQILQQLDTKPLNDILSPYSNFGVTSVGFKNKLEGYIDSNPSQLISTKHTQLTNNFEVSNKEAEKVAYTKYARALMAPGEAVGVLAGQSIGEPSTQLTLNTFHLAGHGAANVTLGIPRLREIVMAAAKTPKTPLITLQCKDKTAAEYIKTKFNTLYLSDIVTHISTSEKVRDQSRQYEVILSIDKESVQNTYYTTMEQFNESIKTVFLQQLVKSVNKIIEQQRQNEIKQGEIQVIKKVKVVEDGVASDQDGDDKSEKSAKDESSESEVSQEESSSNEKLIEVFDEITNNKQHITNQQDFILNGSQLTKFSKKNVTLNKLSIVDNKVTVSFSVGLSRQLLILSLIEELIYNVIIKKIPGINTCFIRLNNNQYFVDIEGNNISIINELSNQLHYFDQMKCNDIYKILNTFGVEAAREAIINEVHSVFDVYHISVDKRHLSIVADFMTQDGQYRSFNRGGMQQLPHILLKASFEVTGGVMAQASIFSKTDNMNTASAAITVGQEIPCGTGAFQLLQIFEETQ